MKLTPLEAELLEALRNFVDASPQVVIGVHIVALCAIKHAEEKLASPEGSEHVQIKLSNFRSPCCQARAYVLHTSENNENQVHLCLECLREPYEVTFHGDKLATVKAGELTADNYTPCCKAPAKELSRETIEGNVHRHVVCESCERQYRVICANEDAPQAKQEVTWVQ